MRYSDLMRYDDSGTPNTCPMIDKVLEIIYASEDCDAKAASDYLEEVRNITDKLRQWGATKAYELDQIQIELEDLKQKYEDLKMYGE